MRMFRCAYASSCIHSDNTYSTRWQCYELLKARDLKRQGIGIWPDTYASGTRIKDIRLRKYILSQLNL
jgi:hypothetical protein